MADDSSGPTVIGESVLEITYQCPDCAITKTWLYDEEGLYPKGLTGCPGQNCTTIHELAVQELDDVEDTDRAKERVYD